MLEQSGANPERLKLELTESLLVSNMKDVVTKIAALVPPPRAHRHRYYGVLAPNCGRRSPPRPLPP